MAGAPERGAAGHEEGGGGLETTFPSSSFAAGVLVAGAPQEGATGYEDRGGGPETCSHCSFFAAGSTVVGAPPKGATGYKEGGRGLETTFPSSSFAAGVPVAGAPQRGAAGYEEGGGRGTTCPRSFFAAGRDQHAVSRATTGRGADSIASHGPTEASLPSPRLWPGLLGI